MKFQDYPNLKYLGKLKTRRSTEIASSRLGVGFETLDRDMWDANQAWPVLDALGIKWARVQSGWAKTEKEPGVYNFSWLDEIIDKLLERGVQPWLSMSYGNPIHCSAINTAGPGEPPVMAECPETGVGFPPIHTPEERAAWQAYVNALAHHVNGRVTHFEVWNEPDLDAFWRCQPTKAAAYVDLVRITAEALRAGIHDAKIIGGACAWGMTVWGQKFLEDCMEAGLHELVDVVSYHTYKSIPERHSTQEIPAFKHILKKYKPELKFWQGEAGLQSHIPEGTRGKCALSHMRTSEAIQARMLLRRTMLELDGGCSMFSYFSMCDFASYAGVSDSTFHYGLVRIEDGQPKLAYYAMQTLATLLGDGGEPAAGRTSCNLSVHGDTFSVGGTTIAQASLAGSKSCDTRPTVRIPSWHANFVNGKFPIHAWWLPDSLEDDPILHRADLKFWMDRDLRLDNPVVIDPVTQEVYAVGMERDRRSCGEAWIQPNPESEGIRVIRDMPISTDPLILTDRAFIEICK